MEPPEGITITPLRVEGDAVVCEVTATDEAVAAIVAEKWTPARRAALRRTIEAARRFVRAADELVPDDGEWFYPGALGELGDALNDAIEAEARTWDDDPVEPHG